MWPFKKKEPKPLKPHCWHKTGCKVIGSEQEQETCCFCDEPRFYRASPDGHGSQVPISEKVVKEYAFKGCKGYYYESSNYDWPV